MAYYLLRCLHCEHRESAVCPMTDRESLRCSQCGKPVENDWEATGPPATDVEYHDSKGTSVGLCVGDDEREDVLRECPSVEVNRAGQIKSKNRRHHRRQMQELSAYERRQLEKDAPRREAEEQAQRKRDAEVTRAAAADIKEAVREYRQRRNRHP